MVAGLHGVTDNRDQPQTRKEHLAQKDRLDALGRDGGLSLTGTGAGETEADGWPEIWGRRVGRGLAVAAVIGLVAWLVASGFLAG